jgi:hypothetical protein
MGDQPDAKPLLTHRTTQKQNKRTQTSIPRVGFEPTTPEFKREKTVHVLDRAATVIRGSSNSPLCFLSQKDLHTDNTNVYLGRHC